MPFHADLVCEAADLVANPLPLAEWLRGRERCSPKAKWVELLRRVKGWPLATVQAAIPRDGHTSGGGVGTVEQPITVTPVAWLRDLARRLGVEWTEACRFVLPDEPRGAGRPKTLPDDSRNRTIRLSDAEYAAVMQFVRELRAKKTA
jgi:hypothetical protein